MYYFLEIKYWILINHANNSHVVLKLLSLIKTSWTEIEALEEGEPKDPFDGAEKGAQPIWGTGCEIER